MQNAIIGLLSEYCTLAGTVEQGDAVLAAVETSRPDAVVMDISMPGRSGLQVLPELRSKYPQLAVVILTNHDSAIYREAAMERGADGYVLKQNAAADLWPTLQAAITSRQRLAQRRMLLDGRSA